MGLYENQWGYHAKDWSLSYVKTPIEVLDRIVHAVSMGGNGCKLWSSSRWRFSKKSFGDYYRQMDESLWKGRLCLADYAVFDKQDCDITHGKNGEVYMVVFNQPYSERLIVKTPKGISVEKASLLDTNEDIKVVETARNEYNVSVPKKNPGEPYVIQLKVRAAKGTKGIYRDALT